MKMPGISETEVIFSVDAVEDQLERIFRVRHFSGQGL